jgi:hypothetical protein
MAEPALRAIAAVGVLSVGLAIGGFTASPVLAQPSDSDGSSQTSSDSGGSDDTSGSGSETDSGSKDDSTTDTSGTDSSAEVEAPDDIDPPASSGTGGSGGSGGGGSDTFSESAPRESARTGSGHSISIPLPRLPRPGEITRGTLPPPSTFFTTVSIPVPTLTEFLASMQIIPTPPPPPGPAFRTQEEAPVIDASTGTAGGGAGGGSDPAGIRAPLVVTVPRAVTVAGSAPKIRVPRELSAEAGVTAPGVAGANTPAIRGSVSPTPGATAAPMARDALPSAGGQRAEAMPRAFARPTVAQLAAVALPGVAGLIVLTFGGGVMGYRQANSVRYVRTAGAERFLA